MFTLLQLARHARIKETQAWEKGAPKAATIEHAREEWACFFPAWAEQIKSNFLTQLTYRVGRERVGWIDDEAFWSSFWEARRSGNIQAQMQNENGQLLHLGPYIEGAAVAASMSFFSTAPPEVRPLLYTAVLGMEQLIDPQVLRWLAENVPGHIGLDLKAAQKKLLTSVQWSGGAMHAAGLAQKTYSTEKAVDVVCQSAIIHQLDNDLLCNLFGQLMVTLPQGFDWETVLTQIQTGMGAGFSTELDLPLIAMCSGHDVGEQPVHKAIAGLGKSLVQGRRLGSMSPMSPGAQLLSVLSVFETISEPAQLYRAVLSLGLQQSVPTQLVELDGLIF